MYFLGNGSWYLNLSPSKRISRVNRGFIRVDHSFAVLVSGGKVSLHFDTLKDSRKTSFETNPVTEDVTGTANTT